MASINKRAGVVLIAVAIAIGLALSQQYSFGKRTGDGKGGKQTPLVTVAVSQSRDLPVKFSAQGHLVTLNQVDIRPQITGTIRSVDFHEGDQIKAGQLLFTLDATDAGAQLHKAQAQAAQIKAQLDDARRDYRRSTELVKEAFISPSAVDTASSKVDTLQAQLNAASADIDSARVQMDRTRITAPISAQAGVLNVHPGSLAQQSAATPLVALVQFDPIGVEFSLPEQNLSQLLAARAEAPITVALDLPGGQVIEGTLIFINNTVNTDTGTINVKARFPNPKKTLWPGAFSRVTVAAGADKDAVVLPPQAILEGPDGRFVYLLGHDDKVTAKAVTLLRIQDRMAVIDGLQSGERVVLEGNQNLRSGALVRVAAASSNVLNATSAPDK
ncbi:MAG TPA: efflux RND transporter periplasmic adaptor subunit [Herbaspirillum sp.]|jgi:RND family efflux transporter MFP subunit